MKHSPFALAFALLLPLGASVPAAAATWDIDASHSQIGFKVAHLVIARVRGEFTDFSGTVTLDEKNIEKSSAQITIKTASITTRNDRRDNHLRSADFFDAKNHPTITFKSTRVKKLKDGSLEMFGKLTMRGVTKTVMLKVQGPTKEVKDPYGNPHVAFTLSGKLNRKDFGLKWDKTVEGTGAVVGDEITLEIEVELKNKRP